MSLRCPLCCGCMFATPQALGQHLLWAADHLRCPICHVREQDLRGLAMHLDMLHGADELPSQDMGTFMVFGEHDYFSVTGRGSDEQIASMESGDGSQECLVDGMVRNKNVDQMLKQVAEGSADCLTSTETMQVAAANNAVLLLGIGETQLATQAKCNQTPEFSQKTQPKTSRRQPAESQSNIHTCSMCSKVFPSTAKLSAHVRRHTREKNHQCKVCSSRFATRAFARVHEVGVHGVGEAPHKCGQCGKAFLFQNRLKRHEKVHEGSRPHQCKVCGRTFAYFESLYVHGLNHSGGKKS